MAERDEEITRPDWPVPSLAPEKPQAGRSGVFRRAASAIRAYPWYVALAAVVGLELAREYLGGRYPILDDMLDAFLVVLNGS